MKVLLVESAAQARRADAVPSATVLALTPESIAQLEGDGADFHTDDELVSDEFFQRVSAGGAARAAELAAALDGLAGEPLGRPVFALLEGELKRMLDSVLGRAAVLHAALESLGADSVARFEAEPAPPSPLLEWGGTSPWAPVVPAVLAARDVRGEFVAGPTARGVYGEHGLAGWQRLEAWPRHAARVLRERRRMRHGDGRGALRGTTAALVAVSGPSVHGAVLELAGAGARVIRWYGDRGPAVIAGPLRPLRERVPPAVARDAEAWAARFREAWAAGAARESIRRVATLDPPAPGFSPIDLSAPVEERLGAFLDGWLQDLATAVERAQVVLRGTEVDLLVSGATKSWRDRRVKEAARLAEIPVVAFQHGGGNGYLEPEAAEYRAGMELTGAGAYVAWGPGVVEEYCSAAPQPIRAVVNPPEPLAALVRSRGTRSPATEPRVLFVPTNHAGELRHGPAGDLPDTTNYRLQQAVVAEVLSRPPARLTVKLPVPEHVANPLPEWVADRERCELVQGGPGLASMMADADAVIVGWPFTVLLEAIATDLPVLCIADRRSVPLPAAPLDLLRRRAIVVTDPATGLAGAVDHLLEQAAGPRTEPDDAFLRRYGLGEPAGDWLPEPLASRLR